MNSSLSFRGSFSSEAITLWMNHLLVIYAFFLPISNRATSTIFVAILILFILRRNYLYYLENSLKNPIVIAFALLFLMHLVWLIGTQNYDYAYKMFRDVKYALFPIIFLSFLDRSFISKVMGGFILGMLFTEFISYSVSFGFLPEKLIFFGRALFETTQYNPTPFFNHLQYSTALALVISFLIIILAAQKLRPTYTLLSVFFIITATINLSIIGGRTGYLIFAIVIPLTFFLLYRKHFLKIIIPLALAIGIIGTLAYSFSPIFNDKINQTKETLSALQKDSGDYRSSFGMRVGIWNYSLEVIRENWLFGVGTGDHMDEVKKVIKTHKDLLLDMSNPHNQLISYALQFGIFGLIIFLNIFYQIFKYEYSTIYQKRVAFVTTTAIAIALMPGDFDGAFFLPIWITILSISLTTRETVVNNIESFKLIISYFIVVSLVSVSVYFQIS